MGTKKTAMIGMAITYVVLLIVDIVLTLNFGELVKYLELNLIYPFIGILGVVVVNLIIIAVVYWLYKRSRKPMTRFYYINLLVTICMTRILVIYNNVQVLMDPPTIQQAVEFAATATTAIKTVAIIQVAWMTFIPYFMGIITYWIWSLDHKIEVKEE